MERRRDWLLRRIMDDVQPSIRAYGFCLQARAALHDYRAVEFASGRHTLTLYHLANYQHVEARLVRKGRSSASRTPLVAAEAWWYRPETSTTREGHDLLSAVCAWVEATLRNNQAQHE